MAYKKLDIKEFREKGYLQELNRGFLHPLGLALEVTVNDDGTESLTGVWDYRDDPDGITYDLANSDTDRLERFKRNAVYITDRRQNRYNDRIKHIGSWQEQIPGI